MKTLFRYSQVIFLLLLSFSVSAQESMLCQGAYWEEDEANSYLKKWANEWTSQKDWEARADVIRKGIIDGMKLEQMPERTTEFNPIIHSTREMDGYIIENIAIESFRGFFITGNLYRPLDPGPFHKSPAILSPHGHGKDKRYQDVVQYRAAALARMGAVVFVYDMLGYADSQQTSHTIPIALTLQTYNSIRVLDYLTSREDVDPTQIGVTGGSGGGTQTILITALDPRITVSVPAVMVSAYFFGGCVCESGMPIHKSAQHQTNNVEIAALAAPRPMLLISDGGDWTKNTPRIEFPYIQKVYAAYGAESKADNVHLPNERHDYNYNKRTAAYNFFGHYLDINPGKVPYNDGYDESFVTILSVEELKVFNTSHPIPAHALQGDEAVMRYLKLD
ncbi:alpha/beta hydrolase [Algoriphagus chordae]|uniref:Acetyl xylan esterase AXE1 n=1 Tax=Algoriphagus chordae TaxID=237019 RepID=A0A2W7QLX2_9BACT|nr:acetylxylan esterase [Algoriphagus chordae]PZX49354.1 acetyl xylan esterase AXE1 [Algoriphagus chordae]